MQIKDVMIKNVETVHPEATIQQAARKMKAYNVGDLPVVRNNEPVGFITDRDIAVRLAAEGWDASQLRVKDLMTRRAYCCLENQNVRDCVHLMKEKNIRRVIVLDENKKISGIVSASDLLDLDSALEKKEPAFSVN